jgi:asparagine synthase (glutamine-hydrolysing)
VSRDFAESYASDNDIAGKLYDSDNLRQSFINHFEYKMEHLLKWEDRNSMHFSLESRVPFLDHRLVERTLAMSSDQIINRGYSKHLLREAMKNTLPEKIRLRQDKVGFETPEDRWFRESKFKKLIWEIIHSKKFRERGILNVEETHSLFQKHLDGQVNISREIWKWINLELWFRKFID